MSSLLDRAAELLRDQLFTGLERVEGPALVLTSDSGTVLLQDLAPVPVLRCSVLLDPGPAAQAPDLLMAAMLEVADVPMARLSFRGEPDENGGRRLVGEVTADLFAGDDVSTGALLAGIAAVQQAAATALDVLAAAEEIAPPPDDGLGAGPADVPGLLVDPPPGGSQTSP
ncbi:MAG TPA: hypothetical protein VFS29_01800 [Motilibacteraceae bacterium]|nr:hypothetical protein [Motilibacteraceae bacterium]